MGGEVDAGLLRDVPEAAAAVVLEQGVAAAHGGDEQVLVAVVVDVAEGRGHADAVRPGRRPPARVMFRNVPPPRFFQSSLPPTWLTK